MQIPKTLVALTSLIPSSRKLMTLARKTRFVLRKPRKIRPDQILRAFLAALCENTPHLRAIAEHLSALSGETPSRQAVFARLKHEASPSFFFAAFSQILQEQCERFTRHGAIGLGHALAEARAVFGRLIIEDASVLPLHQSLAKRFAGAANQFGHVAALRMRWAFDFFTGQTIDAQLHEWRENDQSTAFDLIAHLKPGDMVLRDMGYFCLESLHEIARLGAWFLTRIPEGTVMADLEGTEINLAKRLSQERSGPMDLRVRVGRATPVEGRLVAVRIDPEKAARRKRKLRARLRAEGKVPRKDQLKMCEWVAVFTNAGEELLDAQSVARLYRARWMVEIFFKGMKSGQDLEKWSRHRTNENTIQCLAYGQMILGVLSLNLWRLMGRMIRFADGVEDPVAGPNGPPGEASTVGTIGPLKAMESLVPLLRKVFTGELPGRGLMAELSRLARYAKQERRARVSLDRLILGLLA